MQESEVAFLKRLSCWGKPERDSRGEAEILPHEGGGRVLVVRNKADRPKSGWKKATVIRRGGIWTSIEIAMQLRHLSYWHTDITSKHNRYISSDIALENELSYYEVTAILYLLE
jgi:hypothetical protein